MDKMILLLGDWLEASAQQSLFN